MKKILAFITVIAFFGTVQAQDFGQKVYKTTSLFVWSNPQIDSSTTIALNTYRVKSIGIFEDDSLSDKKKYHMVHTDSAIVATMFTAEYEPVYILLSKKDHEKILSAFLKDHAGHDSGLIQGLAYKAYDIKNDEIKIGGNKNIYKKIKYVLPNEDPVIVFGSKGEKGNKIFPKDLGLN